MYETKHYTCIKVSGIDQSFVREECKMGLSAIYI